MTELEWAMAVAKDELKGARELLDHAHSKLKLHVIIVAQKQVDGFEKLVSDMGELERWWFSIPEEGREILKHFVNH